MELWAIPIVVALLPRRLGLRVARFVSATFPLYGRRPETGFAAYSSMFVETDFEEWVAEHRFHRLIDHADLFRTLLKRDSNIEQVAAGAPGLPQTNAPLLVIGFHYGQGMLILRWLTANGRPPSFVSIRWTREQSDSTLAFVYGRLRNWAVERLTGQPLILTGGGRQAVADALAARNTVFGLIDVPAPSPAAANATLFGRPIALRTGLLEAAPNETLVMVVSALTRRDGRCDVQTNLFPIASVTVPRLATELELRIREVPAAWHFWHLWPLFNRANPSVMAD